MIIRDLVEGSDIIPAYNGILTKAMGRQKDKARQGTHR